MTATVSYEIHVMRGGRWVTSGIYQDKSEALRDARGPVRKRHIGVRVIEEIFDPDRDRFVTRTIYRDNSRVQASGNDAPAADAGGAVTFEDMEEEQSGFPTLVFALLGVPTILLAGIGTLFWLGVV
jgi:hypothetical protein